MQANSDAQNKLTEVLGKPKNDCYLEFYYFTVLTYIHYIPLFCTPVNVNKGPVA